MRTRHALLATAAMIAALLIFPLTATARTPIKTSELREYRLTAEALGTLRERWVDRTRARRPEGGWVEARMELTNADLRLMGLPSRRTLLARRFAKPTAVRGKGKPSGDSGSSSGSPGIATFAGTGFFGIRPGAWVLLLNDNSIGWCSLAHVYGSPGSYKVSTAGHCGKVGDRATAIGVVGNNTPVLIDFGTFSTSHDGGLGDDWALIDVAPAYQHLVTPTMAFWGGPRGMFTKTGDAAAVSFKGNSLIPSVTVNPDPFLAQQIVHYGHGTGVGTGGTPRSGTAISWRATQFMFFGAITPGDSGSGANTLTGDTAGATMEAAGILTHLYVDSRMRQGLGVMGGTRATRVSGTLANGQIVPYPVPTPAPAP